MKAFKAYDIRGEWQKDLNEDIAYRIGFFLPKVLPTNTFLVGRDIRISSDAMFNALTRGLTDAGVNVDSIGLSTTPMVYWATAQYKYQASVMITASHNPKNHNGLKISSAGAIPVGYDTGLNELERLVENEDIVITAERGSIRDIDTKEEYISFQKRYCKDFDSLKVGIDCSNGMAGLFAKKLFGDNAIYINDNMDGNFPCHEPNPLEAENQEQIKKLVLERGCDIGLLFDGDADRVIFIDENGQFISPDLIIALLGDYFLGERKEQGIVLQDIRSSRAIQEYLRPYNNEVVTWRVGRAYAAIKLRELNGTYGGELAGHYYFRDFYYSDSALMAASITLSILNKRKKNGQSLSQIMREISSYHNSGEINFKIAEKQNAMDAIRTFFSQQEKPITFADFDGYRLDYNDYWLNIRPSNTEPYLRFIAEAKDSNKLKTIIDDTKKIISDYGGVCVSQ